MIRSLKAFSRQYHTVKNMQEFNKLIPTIKTPFVLDFTASWCGPCKMLWPVLEKREKESNGKWVIVKIDVDLQDLGEVINDHQVTGVPTLAFYKGTTKLYQRSGYADDAAFRKLEENYLQ